MLTNEEKATRLNRILDQWDIDSKNQECDTEMHKLLLDDCDGKLYRYMPIRHYTKSSLQNNTLHFSSPDAFNDPFDCKLGIDISSLWKAECFDESELEVYLNDFMALKRAEKKLEEIPAERRQFVESCIENKDLIECLDYLNSHCMSQDEKNKFLFNHFDRVYELMILLFEEILKKKGISVDLLPFKGKRSIFYRLQK